MTVTKARPSAASQSFCGAIDALLASKTSIGIKKKLRFVLVKPPLVPEKPFSLDVARSAGYFNYPPTGLLYLAACIDDLGEREISTSVIDLNNLLLKYANEKDDFDYGMWQIPLKGLERAALKWYFCLAICLEPKKNAMFILQNLSAALS